MVSNLPIPFIRMAVWCGLRYFRRLLSDYPDDFEQSAVLAALMVPPGATDNQAFKAISRVYRQSMRAYGYSNVDGAGWQRRQLDCYVAKGRRGCNTNSCQGIGVYRWADGYLCRRCRQRERRA